MNLIDDIRYLFKDADYSYENEYRIIKSYEGKEDEIITCDSSNSVIPGIYTYIEKELKLVPSVMILILLLHILNTLIEILK